MKMNSTGEGKARRLLQAREEEGVISFYVSNMRLWESREDLPTLRDALPIDAFNRYHARRVSGSGLPAEEDQWYQVPFEMTMEHQDE
jgi:hypothetical protein